MAEQRRPGYRDVAPIRDLVSDEEAYEAMQYLDQVAHNFAEAQANADYEEYMLGVAEATGGMLSDEKSMDRRKWEARTSAQYGEQLKAFRKSKMRYLEIKARREAAQTKVDVWRTIHADKRTRGLEPDRR